jgi:hypothetical protein
MAIIYKCDQCNTPLWSKDHDAERETLCPICKTPLRISPDRRRSRIAWGVVAILLTLALVAIPIAVLAACEMNSNYTYSGRTDLGFGIAALQLALPLPWRCPSSWSSHFVSGRAEDKRSRHFPK